MKIPFFLSILFPIFYICWNEFIENIVADVEEINAATGETRTIKSTDTETTEYMHNDTIDMVKAGVSIHQVTYGEKKYPDIVVSGIIGIDTSVKAYVQKHNLTHDFQFTLQHRLAFELFLPIQLSLTTYLNKMIDHRLHSRFNMATEIGARSLGNILTHKDKVSPRIARDVLNEMGRVFLSTYRLGAAKDMFMNALDIQPYNVSTITHLAQTFFMQNKMNRSIPHLLRALEYAPENVNIRLLVARMLTFAGNGNKGDYGKALKIMAKGVGLNEEELCFVGAITLFDQMSRNEYNQLELLIMKNHLYRKTDTGTTLYMEVQRLKRSKALMPLLSFATYVYERMGYTYKRLYKYIELAKQKSSEKDESNIGVNQATKTPFGHKKLHLILYYEEDKTKATAKADKMDLNRSHVGVTNEETNKMPLEYNSLRCIVDNILNPHISIIHIFASNITWVHVKRSLKYYMKVQDSVLNNKLKHVLSNRKPTFRDVFYYSNDIYEQITSTAEKDINNNGSMSPIPIVLIALDKDVQFDNTIRELLSEDESKSGPERTINALLPWDSNYLTKNSRGVRRTRVSADSSNRNSSDNGNSGVPQLKLNDYNFIGFTFNSPLAPSIITNKKAEIYLDDFMASRSICKLFAEHNYQIQSPSLKVHAHRVYGEKVRVNPAQIFEVIEPSNDLAFEVHSNYGVVLV